jgi:hypothetical protein
MGECIYTCCGNRSRNGIVDTHCMVLALARGMVYDCSCLYYRLAIANQSLQSLRLSYNCTRRLIGHMRAPKHGNSEIQRRGYAVMLQANASLFPTPKCKLSHNHSFSSPSPIEDFFNCNSCFNFRKLSSKRRRKSWLAWTAH